MHSRIFQFETSVVAAQEHIFAESLVDMMIPEHADSIDTTINRADDIDWLVNSLKHYSPSGVHYHNDEIGEYIVFEERFLEAYFSNRYAKFMEKLSRIADTCSLKAFRTGVLSWKLYDLRQSFEETTGFWIAVDQGCELHTLDTFLRSVEVGKKYFIGATLDYHF